ncbi:MAG: tetratricopeptide repeat protein [Mariniphaga sp.]|nr:tetratricopeptide repeat protein [Mariniphaga sp.]
MILGYIEEQHHHYDEALRYWDEAIKMGVKLTNSKKDSDKELGEYTIALGNHNKTFAYQKQGNNIEAKSCCLKAIDGHRKLNKKVELAKLLFEMTKIECFEGNYSEGKWKEYIEEAKSIFTELKDYSNLARCIDFISKIAYTLDQKELALQILKEGYEEIKKTKDKHGIAYFIESFALFFKMQGKFEIAEKHLEDLVKFSKSNSLNKYLIRSYRLIADVEEEKGNIEARDRNLSFVILELEKAFNKEQSLAKRAKTLGNIGEIYAKQENIRESLNIFERIAKIYKDLNDIKGYANALLIIAELSLKLRNRKNALENWQKVCDVVKGTAFHEFASMAKINSGSLLINTGDYDMAQRHLEEAQHLIHKYRLRHSDEVEELLQKIKDRRDITKPPKRTFANLVNRLYEGINKKPDALEPLLRHWYTKYEKELFQFYYNHSGLNCILYSDNEEKIHSLSNSFSWLFDYFLVASNETFNQENYDLVVYPYEDFEADEHMVFIAPEENDKNNNSNQTLSSEERILLALNKPSNNGKLPRYLFMPTKFDDEVKIVLVGWGKGLPTIAYNFINQHSADEIVSGNKFVLNIDRFTARDKFLSDLLFCWHMNYLPVYINEEMSSEDVRVLEKVKTEIPNSIADDNTQVSSIKKCFNSLFKVSNDNAKSVLNDFKFDLNILLSQETNRKIISVSLVEFKYFEQIVIYPVLVFNENEKASR